MKDKRLLFGAFASIAWASVAVYALCTATLPKELNAWGDFIAGFSAPLAFFWLVLGYLQQGEELKNNTKALELQAHELKLSTDALNLQAQELKNSVEQQSQLVAATREQIEIDREVIAEERRRLRNNARPKFVAAGEGSMTSGSESRFYLKIVNIGRDATDVYVEPSLGSNSNPQFFPIFGKSDIYRTEIRYATDATFKFLVRYTDADDEPGAAEVELSISREKLNYGPFTVLA